MTTAVTTLHQTERDLTTTTHLRPHSPILPGSTIGVLGGGQLGRMLALAAKRMGYAVHVLSPERDSPAGQVADLAIEAEYDNVEVVERFARNVDVVTFEFENVPLAAAEAAARHAPVRPGGGVLHTTQNRVREKAFLRDAGVPHARVETVESLDQLRAALGRIGVPAVLKSADWGYDGKGQFKFTNAGQAGEAWKAIGERTGVLEEFVRFECEVSVIVVRGLDGQSVTYGPIRNRHANHILDLSSCPAGLGQHAANMAISIARRLADQLDYVGVLCVEYFVTAAGDVLVNELAPRPHNSGHLTIEGFATSQFEQQVRAICGLPLGSTRQVRPVAMANLLGDVWSTGEPRWCEPLREPDVALHLYGKAHAKPGRKMGHLTALADSVDEAERIVLHARSSLQSTEGGE